MPHRPAPQSSRRRRLPHEALKRDWTIRKQMRNFISIPNLGIKRNLKERFEVYNIDEYQTSCLHHKMENKCENLFLEDKPVNYGNYIQF